MNLEIVRWIAAGVLVGFSVFTLYVFFTENFWKFLKETWARPWGKQVTFDLFIGLFLFGFIIFLNEGSIWTGLAWLVPALIVGNPVTLLYFVIHFESIVAHFP